MSNPPRTIAGLSGIIGGFDLFLIDQYGVLHDGRQAYPGAVAALQSITAAGKSTIILTNSGKRAAPNENRLVHLGFPRKGFAAVVSSGEVSWHCLREGLFGAPFVCGAKVHVVGKRGDDYGLDGLDLRFTDDPASAEALLILGTDAPATSLADYRRILAPAARAGVPALSANPDKLMLSSQGLQPASGAIADVYQQLGGKVRFIGKPYEDIYRFALRHAPTVSPERVLAIGDSVEHDIAGAVRMGFKSLLVQGGILAEMDAHALDNLYTEHKAWPTFVCGAFGP